MPTSLALWVDTETTGIDFETGVSLIELSYVVTRMNDHFEELRHPLASGTFLYHGDFDFEPYAEKMHQKNGLIEDLNKLSRGETLSNPDSRVVSELSDLDEVMTSIARIILEQETDGETRFKMAGSNPAYDHRVLETNLPGLMKHLSYNYLDVSALRTFVQSQSVFDDLPVWKSPEEVAHRAQDDIQDHIAEARYYSRHMSDRLR